MAITEAPKNVCPKKQFFHLFIFIKIVWFPKYWFSQAKWKRFLAFKANLEHFSMHKMMNASIFKLREGASISRFVCLSVPRSVGRSVRRNFLKNLDLAKFINIWESMIVWVATYIPYSYQASGRSFYNLICLSVFLFVSLSVSEQFSIILKLTELKHLAGVMNIQNDNLC